MCDQTFRKVALLGLLAFTLAPGLASAGAISVSPSSHDFGRVNVGTSSAAFLFTVTNTGGTLTISSLNHSNPGAGFTASAPSSPITTTAAISTTYSPIGSGPFSDNVTIESDATNGTISFLLTGIANNAPVFTPALASNYSASAGVAFAMTASATDAEGDPLSWGITSNPPLPLVGPTFDTTTGTLNWIPSCSNAGNYSVTITVSDGVASTPASFILQVTCSNNPPTANPGGPYGGCVGLPVQFNGGGSSDPDAGQSLSYDWYFGDLQPHASGQTPTHVFSAPGTYTVSLTVTDNGTPSQSSAPATTSATITAILQATVTAVTGSLNLASSNTLDILFTPMPSGSWNVTSWDQVLANTILTATGYAGSATASSVSIPGTSGKASFSTNSIASLLSGFSSQTFVSVSMMLELHLKNVVGCDIVRIPFNVSVKKKP